MKALAFPLAVALMLAACGEGVPQQLPEKREPAVPAAEDSAERSQRKAFDWTGEWATTTAMCSGGRWRFDAAEQTITTAGHMACDYDVTSVGVDGSMNLSAQCTAEGDSFEERWVVRPGVDGMLQIRRTPASGQAMAVTLRRCRDAG